MFTVYTVDMKQHLDVAPLIGFQHGIYAFSVKNRDIVLNFTLKKCLIFAFQDAVLPQEIGLLLLGPHLVLYL